MTEEWVNATEKFLERWKEDNPFVGALVCGSYVTGDPTEYSDIDLHIILPEDVDWCERGNKILDGYLIEYFANPPRQIREYFRKDKENYEQSSMHQFITGRILEDKDSIVEELKDEAGKWFEKDYPQLEDYKVKHVKYSMYDMRKNLQDAYDRDSESFRYAYYNYLEKVLAKYSKYLGITIRKPRKIYEFLNDSKIQEKYKMEDIPDKKFKKLFSQAIKEKSKDRMIELFEEIVEHIWKEMSGFDIDGWSMRTEVDVERGNSLQST